MTAEREPERLRVGVLGSGAEGAYWASDLGGRGVDVIFFEARRRAASFANQMLQSFEAP